MDHDWTTRAGCRNADPDALFVQGAAQNRAKAVCFGCPVRAECLADALDNRVEFGVWGGLTERERRALLRRRPNVTSWANLLSTAMSDFERDAAETYSAADRLTDAKHRLCQRGTKSAQAVQVVHVLSQRSRRRQQHIRVREGETVDPALLGRLHRQPLGMHPQHPGSKRAVGVAG